MFLRAVEPFIMLLRKNSKVFFVTPYMRSESLPKFNGFNVKFQLLKILRKIKNIDVTYSVPFYFHHYQKYFHKKLSVLL